MNKSSTLPYKEGQFTYELHCSGCHGMNAEGLNTLYPNLHDTAYLLKHRNDLPKWLVFGIKNDSTAQFHTRHSYVEMPENKNLSDVDICNILNYLNYRFWHFQEYTLQEVGNK